MSYTYHINKKIFVGCIVLYCGVAMLCACVVLGWDDKKSYVQVLVVQVLYNFPDM